MVEIESIPPAYEPIVDHLADGLVSIEANYRREGSSPRSRFAGQRLEVVQARWAIRTVLERMARVSPPQSALTEGDTDA